MGDDQAGRARFGLLLAREAKLSTFGDATQKLIALFQEARQLNVTGEVDEPTANALNALLAELGVLEQEIPDVIFDGGLPGVVIEPVKPGPAKPVPGGEPVLPKVVTPGPKRRIEGHVLLEHGLPAEKVTLRLYRRDFGGKLTQLDEKATATDGQYEFSYESDGRPASLEVWTVVDNKKKDLLTRPLDDNGGEVRTGLNLIAPKELNPALAAEYGRLIGDLKAHVGDQLAEARENKDRQDLTVLNRATGWDARLIALAATTEILSTDADVKRAKLSNDAVYGLLRAGLPSDKELLAQVAPDVAAKALKSVRDAGIVAMSDADIGQFEQSFKTFATKVQLDRPAPGSRSSYGALLQKSGLNDLEQTKFATAYLGHRGDAAALWEKVGQAGVAPMKIRKLQLQGKLAFLAGNSEGVTTRLMKKGIADPVQLVDEDLHKPERWVKEIFDQAAIPENRRNNLNAADKAALEPLIPAVYTGATVESRLADYSDDMARKVRLSYPTQVVARMIDQDELKVPAAKDPTVKLLKSASAQGFRLGQTPVETFFKTHTITAGLNDSQRDAAKQQLRTLHRTYQLSPSNESMAVLTSLGLTSAYDIIALSEEEFRGLYDNRYFEIYHRRPGKEESPLVYRKASQVSSVTYNLFTIVNKLDSQPIVAGLSAPVEVRDSVRNELIRQFPTLESLFGSMDFCECEHCRTVLSPAAYLVDLLQFLEPDSWPAFLTNWKSTHGGQDYPHKDADGKIITPYDALIARRPDLPHIPLTCENTHTALPYIDIVNEILEYYVANGKLETKAARDTGDATSAELLAEPQNVIRTAYDKLGAARYPLNLPFDLWIETVRQFADSFETPLAGVLEALRAGDDLFAPAQPFDRSSVFFESLGLSPSEVEVFTDTDPLGNDKWFGLYGLPAVRPAMRNPANDRHATLTIPNADALSFREGLMCTYFDTSANALSAELKAISSIDIADSGGPGQTLVTLVGIWDVAPVAGDLLVCDAIATLQSAKTLSRRLGVTYKEIAAIVETGFVNPNLSKLGVLEKLEVSIRDARSYLDWKVFLGQDPTTLSVGDQKRQLEAGAFQDRLKQLAETFSVTVAKLESDLQAIPSDRVLVLADPDAGCDFDRTLVQKANGGKADPIVFLRINLFVRLWRKLGWTIEETDRALSVFVPRNAPFETANLAKQPLKTALIYIAHLRALEGKVRAGKPSRMTLPVLWSDLPTTGAKPLYAQLFLTRSVLKTSPVFDDPLGNYLTDATVKIKDHLLALQGALGLTADEIERILIDARSSLDAAILTLPNVSLLYRYGLLAKALKLPVRELIALRQLSGLDPFLPLHPDPLADTGAGVDPEKKALELDHPFTQTLRFVEVANEVKDSGLTIEDLDYLLRHRFDGTGKYRQDPDGALALLKILGEGIHAIRREHAVPEDAAALTDEVLRQKLGLALPSEVVERFVAMMNGTSELTATRTDVAQAAALDPATFSGEPAIREVRYDPVRQEQKLTFGGVLFDAAKTALAARVPKPVPPNPHVPSALFLELLGDVQQQARSFFERHLQKQAPNVQPATGFLEPADYDLLFDPDFPLAAGETEQDRLRKRRQKLASAFFPFLQQRLIRQFIVQTLTASTEAEPALVESLLTDARLLAGPGPLLDTFSGTGERGVTAHFFNSNDGSGVRQPTRAVLPDADTALKEVKDSAGNNLSAANSARFAGFLEVPTAGAYRFSVVIERQGAEAELRFDHLPQPLFWKEEAPAPNAVLGTKPAQFLELKPGIPYRFSLDLRKLGGLGARLLVQGETLSKGPLSQLMVYPAVAIDSAQRAVVLLTKALQLVQGLGLSERETRYLLTHPAAFEGASLSQLPTRRPAEDTPGRDHDLFTRFLRLAAYTRLKRDLAGGTDDLIEIFEANGTTDVNRLQESVYPLIARLTRREKTVIQATAAELFAVPSFDSDKPLKRLWEVLQIAERFGAPVSALNRWTRIVSAPATPDEHFTIARDLREAVKARFEPETWQRMAQPIFDRLRQRQRNALVSHVMHERGFARMEQLYEYFLIDPGMEPVVQTSRIRLATASVQLFIQRCLLNMELHVSPSAINAGQWEWMKRYRVWEANRKIFLFPENWLEPEFRDDKTHLFVELEGALLQGDVSSDLVEDAFLQYLKKLEELARLDIVGMHIEDAGDPARRTLHVIGRTYSQPHKYFYRRYAREMWTPWEPVSAEIEGDHLAPVVWRDRLYLFWVTFMDKPATDSGSDPKFSKWAAASPTVAKRESSQQKVSDMTLNEVTNGLYSMAAEKWVEIHLHWSEYLKGEWSTRESGPIATPITRRVSISFDPKSVFIHVSKDPEEDRGVFIHLGSPIGRAFYLAGRNSAPEDRTSGQKPANPFSGATAASANRYNGGGTFIVSFQERITSEPGKTPPQAKPSILQHQSPAYTVVPCNGDLKSIGIGEEAFKGAENEAAVKAALDKGVDEIASLMKPVFYQDQASTFFVEPSVSEQTIEEWQEWVTRTPVAEPDRPLPDRLDILPEIPRWTLPGPNDPGPLLIDPRSLILPKLESDWLVNPRTALLFDGTPVGPVGRPGVEILTGTNLAAGGALVKVHPAGGIGEKTNVVLTGGTLEDAGLTDRSGGLNVIGSGGFNPALEKNLRELDRSVLSAATVGAVGFGR